MFVINMHACHNIFNLTKTVILLYQDVANMTLRRLILMNIM